MAAGLAVHPFFPEGTNVELALVEAPDRVRILIWERGVGPTRSVRHRRVRRGGGGRGVRRRQPRASTSSRPAALSASNGRTRIWLTGGAEVIGAVELWLD